MKKERYKARRAAARRARAAELREAATARTPDQQLARLNASGWRALKERARLEAEINGKKKAA